MAQHQVGSVAGIEIVFGSSPQTVLDGIIMDIIKMKVKVLSVADDMVPITFLP